MRKIFEIMSSKKAQTALELAVFGAILIFVLGGIITTNLSQGLQQNQMLRSMRMAMRLSYETSEGLKGRSPGWKGTAGRNSASVVIVEDRITADSSKYGAEDRIPIISSGSATMSRNLFMPIDYGENFNLPRIDMYINGQHFAFTVAGWRTVGTGGRFFKKIPNHSSFPEWNAGCVECFDLNRDGVINDDGTIADVPCTGGAVICERTVFSWQWKEIGGSELKEEGGDIVDVDGDLKEETTMKVEGGTVYYMDEQEGDMDFTIGTNDPRPRPGLTNDLQMYTFTKVPGGLDTYLQIDQGKLYDGKQYIRTISKREQVDMIQRVIQLSHNTGRYCQGTTLAANWDDYSGEPNPVEVCCSGGSCTNGGDSCFSTGNRDKTCMDGDHLLILVRSRPWGRHGTKWVTDVSNDPTIDFRR